MLKGTSRLLLACLTFSLVTLGSQVQAQTFLAVTEHHPPVQYIEDDLVKGTAVEILLMLLQRSQLQADIQVMPWARAYNKALTGNNVLIFSMLRTKEREPLFHWIGPVSRLQVAVISLAASGDLGLKSLSDSHGYVYGTIRDAYSHHYLLSKGFSQSKNLFLVATMEEQVSLLAKGKIDLLMTDPTVVSHEMEQLGYGTHNIRVQLVIPELNQDLYLAASQQTDPRLVARLRKNMALLQTTEQYRDLYLTNH